MTDQMKCCDKECDELSKMRADNERLRRWVKDLQSGMFITCVYCGHRYGPVGEVPASLKDTFIIDDKPPRAMADMLTKHIEQCPEHPMSILKQHCDELEKRMTQFAIESVEKICQKCGSIMVDDEGKCWRCEVERMNQKWQDYERNYILPTFQWAEEIGFDLQKAVSDNPGKNCVRLLFEHLKAEVERLKEAAKVAHGRFVDTLDDLQSADAHANGFVVALEGLMRCTIDSNGVTGCKRQFHGMMKYSDNGEWVSREGVMNAIAEFEKSRSLKDS